MDIVVLDGLMLSQQGASQSGIIVGLDHGDSRLLLEVQLLFHGFTWCQLGGCEVVIHEDSWYAGLHPIAHCVALEPCTFGVLLIWGTT